MNIKPYHIDIANEVFSVLFCQGLDREDGLKEIPAASLQLLVSALEYVLWDLSGEERETIKKAIGITECLRDEQEMREFKRKINAE